MILSHTHRQLVMAAININNEGVAQLAANDSLRAVLTFTNALDVLDEGLWEGEKDAEASDRIHSSTSLSSLLSMQVPHMQDDSFYVFDQALLLNPVVCSLRSPQPPTTGMARAITAFILFNLSLSGHHNSTVACQRRTSLESTCNVYQLCLQMLEGVPGCALAVAAKNNLARAQWQMGYRRAAIQLLKANAEKGMETRVLGSNDTKFFNEIIMNSVMLHVLSAPVSAPSA